MDLPDCLYVPEDDRFAPTGLTRGPWDRRFQHAGPPAAGGNLTMSTPTDPWRRLAALTPARIGLGRVGAGLPTREVLAFALAHARARDAVHTLLDAERVAAQISALGLDTVRESVRAASHT